MSERQIESRFRLAVKSRGGLSIKLVAVSFTGLPDRLNLLPGGRLFFAEFKFGRNKMSSRQEAVKMALERLGFEVWVVNEHNIDEYINKI
jgi:hypothetical protein